MAKKTIVCAAFYLILPEERPRNRKPHNTFAMPLSGTGVQGSWYSLQDRLSVSKTRCLLNSSAEVKQA